MLPIPPDLSDEDLVEDGMIPGIPATEPHGPYDRDPAFIPSFEERGDVDVWEDEKGVWSDLAPEALLLSEPAIWPAFTDWALGKHELTERDLRKRSAFYCEAIVVLTASSRRAIMRRPEEQKKPIEQEVEL